MLALRALVLIAWLYVALAAVWARPMEWQERAASLVNLLVFLVVLVAVWGFVSRDRTRRADTDSGRASTNRVVLPPGSVRTIRVRFGASRPVGEQE